MPLNTLMLASMANAFQGHGTASITGCFLANSATEVLPRIINGNWCKIQEKVARVQETRADFDKGALMTHE